MTIEPGIYRHADGDYYYIVELSRIKHPDTGVWLESVSYRNVDGGILCTTTVERWAERFTFCNDEPCNYELKIEEDPGRQFQNRSVIENLAFGRLLADKIVGPRTPENSIRWGIVVDQVRWTCDHELTRMWTDIVSFHEKFQRAYRGPPRDLPFDQETFRVCFIAEELEEYAELPGLTEWVRQALAQRGPLADTLERRENRLDALVDMVYVVLGTAYLHGFNFAEAWRRVQRANMAKTIAVKVDDTKRGAPQFDVSKPPGWTPPDHKDLVGSLEPRVYPEGIITPVMTDNLPEGWLEPRQGDQELAEAGHEQPTEPQHNLF